MDAIRTFIAIDIPPWVKTEIAGIQNRLKSLNLNASWVSQANMHMTLKFLGDIDPHSAPAIKKTMTAVLHTTPKFSVSLGGLGVFPNLKRPRAVWIAIQDNSGALKTIWEKTEDAMAALNFPGETREFTPHLTLGRIKSAKGKALLKHALQTAPSIELSPFEITSVKFYQSQLTPKGSIYTVLAQFQLNG